MNNLAALRDSLIAELNQQINAHNGQPVNGQLPARISRLLNRIQKVNQQINASAGASVRDILEQQDALAKKIFDDHQSGPQIRAEIDRMTESIEDFARNLSLGSFHYAAA